MQDSVISPAGRNFNQEQASSLVEIPTPRVSFPYPAWITMMDSYIIA